MTDAIVFVGIFDNASQAHLARIRLEGEGIEAQVFDENLITVDPLLGFPLGRARDRYGCGECRHVWRA